MVVARGTDRKSLLPPTARDTDTQFTFNVSRLPKKGRTIVAVRARADLGHEYRLRVRIAPRGRAYLSVGRFAPAGQATYSVGSEKALPFRIKPGVNYRVRASVTGTSPVTVRVKAWPQRWREPSWRLVVRDARPDRLATSGRVGFLAYVAPNGATTTVAVDSLRSVGVPAPLAPRPPVPTPTPTPTPTTPTPPVAPAGLVGARLPISVPVESLAGSVVYIAPDGDDAASGTREAPMRTLRAAISRVRTGTNPTVVVRGGLYREGRVTIPEGPAVRVLAYPGELPEFRGSVPFQDGWTVEDGLSWHAYTPQPVTNGGGISFTSGQNLTGEGVGKYPDQAWVGGTRLRQVTARSAVVPGTFWVDRSNGRIYLSTSDVIAGGVEVSGLDVFLTIQAPGTVVEGIRINRFSNSADDQGVVRFLSTADGTLLRDVQVFDAAFQAVSMAGRQSTTGLLAGVTLENVTIAGANWMGITATLVDDLTLRRVLFQSLNLAREFRTSPASGAIKATRTRHALIEASQVRDVVGHGFWFDQSSAHVVIAGNDLSGVSGSSVFFEISDDLLLINNFVRSTGERVAKLAGASGLKLVNNTLVGAADPVGIYVDSRSKPGCADPSLPLCEGSYSSDRDTVRPRLATLDWMPRLDLMINNVLANPRSKGYCGAVTTMCIMQRNELAYAPIESIIHKADPVRGIPQTRIDGNVYANGTGPIAVASSLGSFASHTALASRLAGAPVGIAGLEAAGRSGLGWVGSDGTPTSALVAAHGQAVPIPTDPAINAYLPAGWRMYGAVR
jgi:hypothetical protein